MPQNESVAFFIFPHWIIGHYGKIKGKRRTHSKKKKKGRIMLRPGGPKDCGFFGTKT